MKIIADFHVHTKYARATSKNLDLHEIARWSKIKGVQLVAAGDFTHPMQWATIKKELEPDGSGLFDLKQDKTGAKFILSTEVACIYKHREATRRLHHLILSPSLAAAEAIIKELQARGCNLSADGRPILGLSSKDLLQLLLEIDEDNVLIPAHVWTPWFAIFGSKSGYDSVEECFEDLAPHIFALETGLSSDPAMNWTLSGLDKYALISNSDAHSGPNIGREANIFELPELSYQAVMEAIKSKDPKRFLSTIEFFPEEGMYHYDGHRLCNVSYAPSQTKKLKDICPVCHRPLTIGVMNRVDNLRDRDFGYQPTAAVPFKKIVPLPLIISDYLDVGRASKKVEELFFNIIKLGGDEFSILLELELEQLKKIMPEDLAQGIIDVRQGRLDIKPGYDGVYGTVKIFKKGPKIAKKQSALF